MKLKRKYKTYLHWPKTRALARWKGNSPKIVMQKLSDLQGHIFIPYQVLCGYLDRVEDRESTIKQERGVLKPLKANVRKRWRESTPLEELQSDHETRFLEDERRAFKQSMRDNSSYLVSSTPEADSS
jgi:hypothetical protein